MIEGDAEGSSRREGSSSVPQRKTFWRSVSWSSRSPSSSSATGGGEGLPSNSAFAGEMGKSPFSSGLPAPLTPRSQHSSKARSALPPLQPLSISRRSVDEWPKAGSDDLGEWPHPPTPGASLRSYNMAGLNLDVNSGGLGSGQKEFLLKKDKIAFFDKECSRIAEHIYLGSDAVAKNREILKQNGITHVLNCVGFVCPEYFKKDLVYKTLWLQDSPSEDITSILYDVFDYFEDVKQQGGRVLVHCCQGVSRSTSLVIAYLMWRDGRSFDEAFEYVKSARPTTNPNVGFTCQLLQCQKRVHAAPLSPSSVLRMYRMAPHSPYDPLHLVPKSLNRPGALGLDSRGAFVVHVPSAIYVWIGKECHPVMAKDAKAAACQVVRYERAQGSVVMVEEGREMQEFWDALCSAPLTVDDTYSTKKEGRAGDAVESKRTAKDQVALAIKLGTGNKKVQAYDVDYEIFQKALSGGVVPPVGSDTKLPEKENGWSALRQKFSNGSGKDLVLTSRMEDSNAPPAESPLVRDSDSRQDSFAVDASDPSWVLPSPTLSPASVFSDSNTSLNSSTLSPSPSPSFSPSISDFGSSSTPSPVASTWSDFTFMSSRSPSPTAPFDKPFPFINRLEPAPRAVPAPNEGHPLSLAERRGSMSPSLKLSSLVHHHSHISLMRSRSISLPVSDENKLSGSSDSMLISEGPESSSKKDHPLDATEMGSGTEVNVMHESSNDSLLARGFHLKLSTLDGSAYSRSSDMTDALLERQESQVSGLPKKLTSNDSKSSIFRWPDLRRAEVNGNCIPDSNSVFLSPVPALGEEHIKVVYVWVGKNTELDRFRKMNNNDNASPKEFDWERFSSELVKQMELPSRIHLQIVEEEKEPEEFLDHLKSISLSHIEDSC
ncbi:Protein-tyrosine-phosphatase [Nymphaea thermarum]|nr:Protein-tyrosine-phosphatase [Nymphaea thermarum]